jgi:uncharacterized protein YbjT (DUF2867 family)
VVRALEDQQRFRGRGLTRHPEGYEGPADEVVGSDLTDPSTLGNVFEDAYGAFVVTNFWEEGPVDEVAQGIAAVRAAKAAGVQHYVWSTLPDVDSISSGKYRVPHFSGKAQVDAAVEAAGFRFTNFVEAPFYFQNLTGQMAPQPHARRQPRHPSGTHRLRPPGRSPPRRSESIGIAAP